MPRHGTYAQPAAMVHVDRPAGQNDVGVVAWLLTLKTPECPQGRQVPPLRAANALSSVALPWILLSDSG